MRLALVATIALVALGLAHSAAAPEWRAVARASPRLNVSVQLYLRRDASRVSKLKGIFDAVSDPSSPQYGKHLPVHEAAGLLVPTVDSVERTLQWLKSHHGIDESQQRWSPVFDAVAFNASAAAVERIVGEELWVHEHRDSLDMAVAGSAGRGVALPSHPAVAKVFAAVKVIASPRDIEALHRRTNKPSPFIKALSGRDASTAVSKAYANAKAGVEAGNPYPFFSFPPPNALMEMDGSSVNVYWFLTCPGNPPPIQVLPLSKNLVYAPPVISNGNLYPCGTLSPSLTKSTLTIKGSDGSSTSISANAQTLIDSAVNIPWTFQHEDRTTETINVFALSVKVNLNSPGAYTWLDVQALVTYSDGDSETLYDRLTLSSGAAPVNWRTQIGVPMFPPDLTAYYGVPTGMKACNSTTHGSSIAVDQPFTSGFYDPADVTSIFSASGIDTSLASRVEWVSNITVNSAINNNPLVKLLQKYNSWPSHPNAVPNNPSNPGDETSLDVQWMAGVAPGTRMRIFHGGYFETQSPSGGISGPPSPFMGIMLGLLYEDEALPYVLSLSYGMPESNFDDSDSKLALTYQDQNLMAAGAAGVSIFISSGDTGAFMVDVNTPAAGQNALDATCSKFQPSWPATSPYVTTVGATMRRRDSTGSVDEVMCTIEGGSGITSGGGISNMFDLPSWQADAVNSYISTLPSLPNSPPSSWFASGKRAYPDVALFGHNFNIFMSGQLGQVDGTSASSPSFGSLISLLNDRRSIHGLPPLGFLNPLLYSIHKSNPEAFNDITFGNNRCLGQAASTACCQYGYPATSGWDAATGLGSINFDKLAPLVVRSAVTAACT